MTATLSLPTAETDHVRRLGELFYGCSGTSGAGAPRRSDSILQAKRTRIAGRQSGYGALALVARPQRAHVDYRGPVMKELKERLLAGDPVLREGELDVADARAIRHRILLAVRTRPVTASYPWLRPLVIWAFHQEFDLYR